MKKLQESLFNQTRPGYLLVLILLLGYNLSLFAVNNLKVSLVVAPNESVNGTYTYQGEYDSHHYWESPNGWVIYWWDYWGEWDLNTEIYGETYYCSLPAEPEYPINNGEWNNNPDMGFYSGWKIEEVDASLPVELTSFSAEPVVDGVQIKWTTESEVNNLGFILERLEGGGEWIQIGSYQTLNALRGQGNTSSQTEYTLTDEDVQPGATYSYRLSDVDTKGNVSIDDVITITLDALPEMTDLLPAYPNPFNPTTKTQYALAEDVNVTLAVMDMRGRTVQTIISSQNQSAGSYSVHWNGNDDFGQLAASGIYFLVLRVWEVCKTQKVILVR